MQTAAIPHNEAARLAELRSLGILDTPPERRFDQIVQCLIDELKVPMALISLVEKERQWFKAQIGIGPCQTGREESFCAHAILQLDLLVVSDATQDARFVNNPLVQGSPWIRFYAGAPLVMRSGLAMGTLCVIGTEPRQLTAQERDLLSKLRDEVVDALEQRHSDER